MPDVPTLAELGYPGFEIEGWLGVFVPAATPKDIVAEAFRPNSPASSRRLKALRASRRSASYRWAERRKTFDKALRRDLARWADVVKATGVKGE